MDTKKKAEFFRALDEQPDEWGMILFLEKITKERRLALLIFAVERHEKLVPLLEKFGEKFSEPQLGWFLKHFPGSFFEQDNLLHIKEKKAFDLWLKVSHTNNDKKLSAPTLMTQIVPRMPQVVLMHMFKKLLDANIGNVAF